MKFDFVLLLMNSIKAAGQQQLNFFIQLSLWEWESWLKSWIAAAGARPKGMNEWNQLSSPFFFGGLWPLPAAGAPPKEEDGERESWLIGFIHLVKFENEMKAISWMKWS